METAMKFTAMNIKTAFRTSIWILALGLLLGALAVSAHSDHPEHGSLEQAEAIINAKLPCEDLSEEQLEMLGDYYMEQLHPGEAHEVMDEMMGGEGSAALRQVHINMARAFYCGESSAMSPAMMNMMMGRTQGGLPGSSGGMMGSSGMMGTSGIRGAGGMGSMMGWSLPLGYAAPGYGWMLAFSSILYYLLLIGLIIALALWIANQLKRLMGRRKN